MVKTSGQYESSFPGPDQNETGLELGIILDIISSGANRVANFDFRAKGVLFTVVSDIFFPRILRINLKLMESMYYVL